MCHKNEYLLQLHFCQWGPNFLSIGVTIHILQELQYKANHKQWLQMEKSACTRLAQNVTSQIFTGIHILTEAYRYGMTICVSLMWYSILSDSISVLYFCILSALDNIWGGFIYISLNSNVCNRKYMYIHKTITFRRPAILHTIIQQLQIIYIS